MNVSQKMNLRRRAFLKKLGFGCLGLGFVSLWNGCSLPGSGPPAVTVNAKGKVIKRKAVSVESFVEDLGNGLELEMVEIPAGKFMMGSPEAELERLDAEGPQHEVTVSEFAIGRFAVTQAQYEAVMGENPSHFKGAQRPVERVSRYAAQKFCQQLSQKTGREYRLPSEAEWEYACRAGTTTPFHFGETITYELANYFSTSTYADAPLGEQYRAQTMEVGSFPPNAFGLHDMHGNVSEWCADRWHNNYDGAPEDGSAWMTAMASSWTKVDRNVRCVVRGGAHNNPPRQCRSAFRSRLYPDEYNTNIGFRVVSVAPV